MKDKHVAAIVSGFAIVFGLSTCNAVDFISGLFAGAATLLAYIIWTEDDTDEADELRH